MLKNRSKGDRVFDTLNVTFFLVVLAIVLYPLYFIIIASISDPVKVNTGAVWFWPVDMTLEGYRKIFQHEALWNGYRNSALYTVVGTSINVALLMTGGYALSRKDVPGRNIITLLIVFTMFFQGGIIPTYLIVRDLGMLNTMWALIIPNAVSVYHLIVVRTYFESTIPIEMLEASKVDGCNNTRFFLRIVLPLSLPIIAVMVLFSAVVHWNSYFSALIYLRDESKYPLQMVLREILVRNSAQELMNVEDAAAQQDFSELIKYGVVIVSSLPVLILYPFVQRFFIKGVMIGSIKG
ncbi:carbohydrate ABC transporter permease [Paenibacillus sp. 1P07SE]|uniref:carbohydrate ABC transporter permease n=1 Tax=Paenibacillus sp. 1P07SE TaxID=3132209 RepID=UPI0039A5B8EB